MIIACLYLFSILGSNVIIIEPV